MKKWLIIGSIILVAVVVVVATGMKLKKISNDYKAEEMKKQLQLEQEIKDREDAIFHRLRLKADTALAYCKENNFDQELCFLVDFSIHSGLNRFFIWNFESSSIVYSSLCAHGYGNRENGYRSSQTKITYSNEVKSYCSSLGKYKTGDRSYSNWGIHVHYKLHGLEKSNNRAFERIVVLHSYQLVPNREIHPFHLPLGYSQGCPVISDNAMQEIDNVLKNKKIPTLLWIYE